jgi:hypothetical protein
LSAGNAPITPALHWAITRSGLEMMNSGEPITGRRRDRDRGLRLVQHFSGTRTAAQTGGRLEGDQLRQGAVAEISA